MIERKFHRKINMPIRLFSQLHSKQENAENYVCLFFSLYIYYTFFYISMVRYGFLYYKWHGNF